jgi:hypothetical protein
MTGPADLLEMTLPVRDWSLIDATMDNTVSIAAQNGNAPLVDRGRQVRETGWAAVRRHPRRKEGWGGWPPQDEELSVALPSDAWRFIASELLRWADVQSLMKPDEDALETPGSVLASRVEERIASSL